MKKGRMDNWMRKKGKGKKNGRERRKKKDDRTAKKMTVNRIKWGKVIILSRGSGWNRPTPQYQPHRTIIWSSIYSIRFLDSSPKILVCILLFLLLNSSLACRLCGHSSGHTHSILRSRRLEL
jgi:hypothetical protein